MRLFRPHIVSILAVLVTVLPACDTSALDLDGGEEPAEFTVEASSELSQMIESAPSDFTWDFFIRELIVSSDSEGWSGELELCTVRIEGGGAQESACSPAVETDAGALADGIRSESLIPGSGWFPGSSWFPGSEWVPGDSWFPGSQWVTSDPQIIADAALSDVDLGAEQAMVAVYVRGTPATDGVRPFGVILNLRE